MPNYHMNRIDREIRNTEELSRILKNGKYITIALCRDNEPYIVTLSYGYDERNSCLYFHAALKGLKLDFIKANPNVCGTIIQDLGYIVSKCKHHFSSLVLWGKMMIVSDDNEKREALRVLIRHLEPDPEPMIDKIIGDENAFSIITILKLNIEKMTGKRAE